MRGAQRFVAVVVFEFCRRCAGWHRGVSWPLPSPIVHLCRADIHYTSHDKREVRMQLFAGPVTHVAAPATDMSLSAGVSVKVSACNLDYECGKCCVLPL